MKRNQIIALVAAVVGVVLLVGIIVVVASGGGDDTAAPTTTSAPAPATTLPAETTTSAAPETTTTDAPEPTTTDAPEPTTTLPRQPLTGEIVDSEADMETKPALVVKIDNAPPARPNHTGLAVADIVYEEIVEGTITRFAAIFHTQGSDPVGPIRSGRTQDVDLLTSYNSPLFAWSGGNPGVTAAIANSFLTDLNWQNYAGSYYRGPGVTPHNLYSNTDTLWALTPEDHPGPPVQQFHYLDPDEEAKGEPVTRFDVQMSGIPVDWDWSAERGMFERSQAGVAHMDKTHGRIGATNVVVLGLEYQPSVVDARSPEAQTLGSGPAYVFRDGKVVAGRWQRENPVFPMEFVGPKGKPLELAPGNTWIELAERSEVEGADFRGVPLLIDYAS